MVGGGATVEKSHDIIQFCHMIQINTSCVLNSQIFLLLFHWLVQYPNFPFVCHVLKNKDYCILVELLK